ncbi:hypothetical protein INR49_008109 [Caranx melampygus]|nr:hypothetical protein INR49_008109 [Caranx melampygus]
MVLVRVSSNSYQPRQPAATGAVFLGVSLPPPTPVRLFAAGFIIEIVAWLKIVEKPTLTPAQRYERQRAAQDQLVAEPPGVPGAAAASTGSAAAVGSSTGKSGVPQAPAPARRDEMRVPG